MNKTKRYREKKLKSDTIESINSLYEGIEMVFNTFKILIFLLQTTDSAGNSGMLQPQTEYLRKTLVFM